MFFCWLLNGKVRYLEKWYSRGHRWNRLKRDLFKRAKTKSLNFFNKFWDLIKCLSEVFNLKSLQRVNCACLEYTQWDLHRQRNWLNCWPGELLLYAGRVWMPPSWDYGWEKWQICDLCKHWCKLGVCTCGWVLWWLVGLVKRKISVKKVFKKIKQPKLLKLVLYLDFLTIQKASNSQFSTKPTSYWRHKSLKTS